MAEKVIRFSSFVRYARIAPRKLRYVANLVRGKNVNEAFYILDTTTNRGSYFIRKCLKSALDNATYEIGRNRWDIDVNEMKIVKLTVDGGPMMKRTRPSSMRHPYMIRKRFSHLRIEVAPIKEQAGGK